MLTCDLVDIYYMLELVIQNIPKLAVLFPTSQHQEPLIALPLVVPMGWMNSGSAFYAATEIITDMANMNVNDSVEHPPHPLDTIVKTIDYTRSLTK